MLLWKAADLRDPPEEARNIANFGWSIDGSAITPAVSTAPVAPQVLLDAVSCSCNAECKAHTFHALTTGNATFALVLSPASSLISKTMKGSQVSMMNKYILYFIVIYIYTCISKWLTNKFKFIYFYSLNIYMHLEL